MNLPWNNGRTKDVAELKTEIERRKDNKENFHHIFFFLFTYFLNISFDIVLRRYNCVLLLLLLPLLSFANLLRALLFIIIHNKCSFVFHFYEKWFENSINFTQFCRFFYFRWKIEKWCATMTHIDLERFIIEMLDAKIANFRPLHI